MTKSRYCLFLFGLFFLPISISAQSTAFTYQGRLIDGGQPGSGLYDLQFGLVDSPTNGNSVGPVIITPAVPVTNGLFTVALDFGGDAFGGPDRWLMIGVRTNGSTTPYAMLLPGRAVVTTPYAIFAISAGRARTAATLGDGGASLTNVPMSGLVGTIGVDQLPPSLAGWAILSPDAKQDALGYEPATNSFAGITNALGFAPATNGVFSGDGTGLIISGSNVVGTISAELLSGQIAPFLLPDNLPSWAGIAAESKQDALGYAPATNSFEGITNALGFAPATNGIYSGDGTGLIVSGSNLVDTISAELLIGQLAPFLLPDNLPNWAGIAVESKQDALGYAPATNSFAGVVSALGYTPSPAVTDIAGNASTANYATYTGTASNAPGSLFALDVKGDQTNEGGLYINNAFGLGYGGIRLSTDGGITTGGYLSVANNTGIFDIPAASQAMMLLSCDVPNGLVTYGGQPFLTHFDGVEGGYSTGDDFPFGCNTFTIGQYGQVVLNNPLSQSWDIWEPEFESPQLVFQSEILTGPGEWGPTNYWAISQVSNVLALGPMLGTTNHLNGAEAGYSRQYVEGSVFPAIVITTNGNVGIGTASPSHELEVAGEVAARSFIHLSDRQAKEGFREVNAGEVLEAVVRLPIQRWRFIQDGRAEHIGPMAQDFSAAFKVGRDDKHIDTLDANGVALAAIQGLNQKLLEALKQQQTEITELRRRLDTLEQRLATKGVAGADAVRREGASQLLPSL